ncbi:hypothetical protein MPSI1_004027 [Malassezia psittaci]|uniref:Uncharacterized protein n=1 Tax=Malassezia psittaci TaxID=1821823 RepID=A0AAF0JG06_9BASI|nr:hypothetical protein MPSI1_004027 [Malassezia psittaci]
MRILRDLNLLPHFLGSDWSSVFLQPFHGAATIWPKSRLRDWPRVLTDPDPAEMRRLLFVGQNVTFPKLHMISNRIHLERAISRGRQSSQDQVDAQIGDQQASVPELNLPRPNSTMSQRSEMGDESEREDVNSEGNDASEAFESVEKLQQALQASPKDLRKDLSRNAISVLETYSPEWFEFLHGADSPYVHTPAESDGEDDPKKRLNIRRAFTTGSGLREWRQRGSMHADGTLSSLAAEELSAESDGNEHEHHRSVSSQQPNSSGSNASGNISGNARDSSNTNSMKRFEESRQTLHNHKLGSEQHTQRTPTDASESKSSAKSKKKSKRKPRSKAQQGSKDS